MRKIGLFIFLLLWYTITTASPSATDSTADAHKQARDAMTIVQVLHDLKRGNERLIHNQLLHRDIHQELFTASNMPYPKAVILNCMDSRNIPEVSFDQASGDLFVVRVVGNVLNDDILGSMEYATAKAGAKLIVVLGHTHCGAIYGACNNFQFGHLTDIFAKIQPAVNEAKSEMPTKSCEDPDFIDNIAKHNVLRVMQDIRFRSHILDELITKGQIGLVGAIYDMRTGRVDFLTDLHTTK